MGFTGVKSDLVFDTDKDKIEMNYGHIGRFLRGVVIHVSARVTRSLLAPMLYFAACASPAWAHPHAWIDLRSTVVLDSAGRVTAIEQEWLIDQFYTIFLTEELSGALGTRAEALAALSRSHLQNLRAYDYFTEVRAGGAKISLRTVSEFESELREGRLWMRFVVPLATTVDPARQAFTFAVFDPTYYIEILHSEGDEVAFRGAENQWLLRPHRVAWPDRGGRPAGAGDGPRRHAG